MKNLILFISAILLFGCSNDETNQVILPLAASTFKVILTDNTVEMNTIYTLEYGLDSDGKVLFEINNFTIEPQYNSISIFKYDNQGRVTKELRNNKVYKSVIWNENVANLYDNENHKIADFTFSNNNLMEYRYEDGNHYKFNYDSNDNVISIEKENAVYVEYLDYDITLSNPMSKIKSIGILRLDSDPYFKNFFETKKAYPYDGGDIFVPLTYYHYQKTVNTVNKIISVTNDENNYITNFDYN